MNNEQGATQESPDSVYGEPLSVAAPSSDPNPSSNVIQADDATVPAGGKPANAEMQRLWDEANALRERSQFTASERVFRECTLRQPDWVNAWMLRSNCLSTMGRLGEAVGCLQRALQIGRDEDHIRKNLGLAWMTAGDLERGLPEYEQRLTNLTPPLPEHPQPMWRGETPNGRHNTLLLQSEQGIGDVIQFVRYAKLAKQMGLRVLFDAYAPLTHLLRTCPYLDAVVPRGLDLPSFSYRASVMSLPYLFGTTIETIPCDVPYLNAEPMREQQWRPTIAKISGFRIGIVWQGNRALSTDRFRSFALKEFQPIARLPGVKLVSLQKNAGTEQLQELAACEASQRFEVITLGDRWDADGNGQMFLDTAAVMKSLDIVITCDTSIAHLAGALGVPVWVGLSFVGDWRWFRERPDSPWYPTMRLFRQRIPGDWQHVFHAMACALQSSAAYRKRLAELA